MSYRDEQEQPIHCFDKDRIFDRSLDELIGISRGLMADGIINQAEAEFLYSWLKDHMQFTGTFPFNVIFERLDEILSDGIVDNDEKEELFNILKALTGDDKEYLKSIQRKSTTLPLDQPAPEVSFEGKKFVLTGIFTVGNRKECKNIISELGGQVQGRITKDTDYLVIGDVASDHWVHTTHGRKIEEAIILKNKGLPIKIISEHHWIKYTK